MPYPVNSITAAVMFSRLPIENGLRFANDLIERTGTLLDFDPTVLPMNQPLPPEAPRIILRSRDRALACEIALNRFFLHYYGQLRAAEPLDRVFPMYRETLYRLVTAFDEIVDSRPNRLGFVVRIVRPCGGDASAFLQEEMLADDRLRGAVETQIHCLHEIELADIACNRWSRLRSLRPPGSKNSARHLALEVDINTRADIKFSFESNMIVSFYLEAYEHIRAESERLFEFSGDAGQEPPDQYD